MERTQPHAGVVDATRKTERTQGVTLPPYHRSARPRHREKTCVDKVCARTTRAPENKKLERGSVTSVVLCAGRTGAAITRKKEAPKGQRKQ